MKAQSDVPELWLRQKMQYTVISLSLDKSSLKGSLQLENIKKMASLTPINSQITDAVTQTNVKVIGESPAILLMAGIIKDTRGCREDRAK